MLLCTEEDVEGNHATAAGKIDSKKLFYLMTRGLDENKATELLIMGFIDAFKEELPLEYAVEMNNLINLELEGSIG